MSDLRWLQFLPEQFVDSFRIIQVHWCQLLSQRNAYNKRKWGIPWWPALLTMYILPRPFPARRRFSTDWAPPWGSIQSESPSARNIHQLGSVAWSRLDGIAQTKVTGILSASIRSTRGMCACAPGARICANIIIRMWHTHDDVQDALHIQYSPDPLAKVMLRM